MIRVNLEKWGQTEDDLRRLATESAHQRTRERFLALFLMVSQNICSTEVARRTGRDNETVLQWVRTYNEQGLEALTWCHTGGRRPFSDRRIRNKSSTPSWNPSPKTTFSRAVAGR